MRPEVWKPIAGWPAYEVSSLGRVRRVGKTRGATVGRVLKSSPNSNGYLRVVLYEKPRVERIAVHILVADAFLGPSLGREVSHRSDDRGDNSESNLRHLTPEARRCNRRARADTSSQFKGVSWDSRRGKWRADIQPRGSATIFLGRFDDEAAAGQAYDDAAQLHFGEFARLNLSPPETKSCQGNAS